MMNEKRLIINQKPIPQARPRVCKWGTYDPSKDKKVWIKHQIKEQFNERLEVPIEVELHFYFPIPKSASKKKHLLMLQNQIKHIKKPDIDNCIKLFIDSMTDIVYKDDNQIYFILATKEYAKEPRTEIFIRWQQSE